MLALLAGSYLLLQNSKIQTFIIQRITTNLSRKTNAHISIGKVDFAFFNKLVLRDVLVAGTENDTIFYTNLVSAEIDSLKFKEHRLALGEINFNNNRISLTRDSLNQFNFSFILDSLRSESNDTSTVFWNIECNSFGFHDSEIGFTQQQTEQYTHFFVHQLNLSVSDIVNFADSTAFKINDLNLNYNNQVQINRLSANVTATSRKIEITGLNMESDHSVVNNLNMMVEAGKNEIMLNEKMDFDFTLEKSMISIAELSGLIPSLVGMDENIEVSGRIYGNIHDLKGKGVTLRTGEITNATFDFYVNGIEDPETMYLFLELKNLETTIKDIKNFEIVRNGKPLRYKIPEPIYQSGLLSFTGNFSGFLSDFVTFGTLKSQMGTIKTDVSVIPKADGLIAYKGKISTTDFDIGRLFKLKNIGRMTFNGQANGDYKTENQKISGLFKGEIAKIDAHGYEYKDIQLDGFYKDKMFDGMVSMNDTNLQFSFAGRMDASKEIPDFDFNLKLNKALPANLNLFKNFPQSELAFTMKAKFTGNKIDNLKGVIVVDDGYYKNKNGVLGLNGIQLISVPREKDMELSLNSDYFDLKIEGNYQFQDIAYSIKKSLNQFVPSLKLQTPENFKANIFDYRINVKYLDDITNVFAPGLTIETPFFLYGKINSDQSDFELEGSIPGFTYKNLGFRSIFISNKVIDNQYVSKLKIKEIGHSKGASVFNFSVNSEIAENRLHNKIDWYAHRDSSGYSSIESINTFVSSENSAWPKIVTHFKPTEVFLAGVHWKIDHFSTTVDSPNIEINEFKLHNNNQLVEIDGNISTDSTQILAINFGNINLESFQKGVAETQVKGMLNCSVNASQIYKQPRLIADANINGLQYKNQLIGDVVLSSLWDQKNAEIDSKLEIVKNNKRSFSVRGSYKPENGVLNYQLKADSLPLQLLETVIAEDLFNSFSGSVSGVVKVGGTLEKISMYGGTKIWDGGLTVDYTKTRYITSDSVYFKNDTILFRNITLSDIHKNKGKLNGVLVHQNFGKMQYDINVTAPKIKVLNTTIKDNELFYGEVFADCHARIYGSGLVVKLTGSMTSLPGSTANISMEYKTVIEKYDFIEFINSKEKKEEDNYFYNPPQTDFTVSLNIEVTPDAKIQLVYSSQIGDIIKAEGEGIMLFEMNKYGEISLSGDYTVVKGDYLFTLQSIVNKRFIISPGGTIMWSGDPYNAIIDIKAIYQLKTSLSDLVGETYGDANYLYQRVPVECVILLTDELINPSINFDINLPDENEGEKSKLQQYFNTEEEVNKQILSLIILGKFYTPEYMRGQYETSNTNMIGTTASELLSNQLSNWLSQINDKIDFGVKYRPGNSITDDEVELALSTQIFNDRVILNGNIGNNVNPESKNSSQFVGDVDVRVKLTPNGKLQLKAYNHANNDLIYETAPYTQGVGISFKEEYNTFGDLLRKIGAIFKKKES